MYFLTVKQNENVIVDRQEFGTYELALAYTARYYRSRLGRSAIIFTTEVMNGEFMVSYAVLRKASDIVEGESFYREKLAAAAKCEGQFDYDASYVFSIQSERGIREADALAEDIENKE